MTSRNRHAPSAGSASAGGLLRQAERTVGLGAMVSVAVVLVTLLVAWVWPLLSFAFSSARPIVDQLYGSSVYLGHGVDDIDRTNLEGIIGTRPIAVVVLTSDDTAADDPSSTCQAVSKQLPDLLIQVVVDGKARYGCEGKDVHLGPGVKWFQWDFMFWTQQGYATELATGDVPEITRSLALAYDAEVQGGRVVASTREFQAPPHRTWIAMGVTAGVIGGAVVLFLLLRWGIRWGFARADRYRDWTERRDRIDSMLGEIALAMMSVDPAKSADKAAATAMGEVAADYRWALDELSKAAPGSPLDVLEEHARAVRERLTSAKVLQ